MSLIGKVILITGASSGIGAACAEYFAKEGSLLALTGRSAEKFEKIVEKIKENGAEEEPLVILADINTDAERIISETIDKYGKLDVLINNAGVGNQGSIEDINMQDYDNTMNTNIRAAVEITHYAIPHLIESKGNILNVSSVTSIISVKNLLAYSMSKAAMDQFTKCVAMELAEKGVRVNSVNPGFIRTPFHGTNFGEGYQDVVDYCVSQHPLGHIGSTEDCVNAIAFFIKESASFVTGSILLVDGGLGRKAAF